MGFMDDYQPVEDRIRLFYDDHPAGQIVTDLIRAEDGEFIVKALVYRVPDGERPDGTGYAQEHVTDRGVNAKSALENCETSAIGRALANIGYAPKGARPSREEMSKVGGQPVNPPSGGNPSSPSGVGPRCPNSGHHLWDNRDENVRREAKGKKAMPAFKCVDRDCGWKTWNEHHFDPDPIREDYEQIPIPPGVYRPDEEPFE